MNILEKWNKVFKSHLDNIKNVLNTTKSISEEYDNSKQDIFDIGFNVFTIASDLYYRENFHSDIIKAILDPTEKHNQKTKYLYLFIDLLNKINDKINIHKSDFRNATVLREENKIDILIKDNESKKAIIIENKINNAGDMSRQIPRYYGIVKQEYEVAAIVYITLDLSKSPDKADWTEEDKKQINDLLIVIPSYERSGKHNLYEHWLMPSIVETQNIDSMFLLKQYGNLLKFLNTNNMDTVSLEKFYDALKEGDNLKTSISIRNMLNDLPTYLAVRIEDKYRNNCSPFGKVWRYQNRDAVFEGYTTGNFYFKLDIWCSENGYEVFFWDNRSNDIENFIQDIKALENFEKDNWKSNSIKKHFNIFEEKNLFDFIDNFLIELKRKNKR